MSEAETPSPNVPVNDGPVNDGAVNDGPVNDGAVNDGPANDSPVTELSYDGKTIHLLGTAHVSKQSVEDVKRLVETVNPRSVCIELDPLRFETLMDESRWRKLDIFQVVREQKVLFLLASIILSAYQRRIGERLGVKPGAEMLAAVEAARKADAELVLADRNIQATLKRTWANLSLWNKGKVLASLIASYFAVGEISEEQIEELKHRDAVSEMLDAFAHAFPQVKTPLIDERDAFLISKIREADGPVVVGVVGAGHVRGMVQRLNDPVDRDALSEIPPPSATSQVLKWVVPAVVIAIFMKGYLDHEGEALMDMLFAWVLPNALFAGLGALVAGAMPLTTVVAVVGSPITSLNPALPLGVLTGTTEAWRRRPTVADCERVNEDSKSLRGIYRNRFTRVLWVTLWTTLGSAAGGWVGAAQLLRYLDLPTVLGAVALVVLLALVGAALPARKPTG